MYSTITTIVADPKQDHDGLAAALKFAQQTNAHLEVICLAIDAAPVDVVGIMGTAIPTFSIQESQELAEELRTWACSQTKGYNHVSVSPVIAAFAGVDHMISRFTRFSDIVITKRGDDPNSNSRIVFDALLTSAKVPVLVACNATLDPSDIKRAVVAWDESDKSLSAAKHALPFLAQCNDVEVVMVAPPRHDHEQTDPGTALMTMLARNGVKSRLHLLPQTMPTVADQIQRFAADTDADLIVMGCYGHSPMRERLLGGVTRDMIQQDSRHLLLAT